jgi:hypothetical protein
MGEPDVEEIIVDRVPEYRGWQIRTADQLPGQGTVVTDAWLATFGFLAPTKFNINKIIDAMAASLGGYAPEKPDLEASAKKWGDPFSEKGSAIDREFGETTGKFH